MKRMLWARQSLVALILVSLTVGISQAGFEIGGWVGQTWENNVHKPLENVPPAAVAANPLIVPGIVIANAAGTVADGALEHAGEQVGKGAAAGAAPAVRDAMTDGVQQVDGLRARSTSDAEAFRAKTMADAEAFRVKAMADADAKIRAHEIAISTLVRRDGAYLVLLLSGGLFLSGAGLFVLRRILLQPAS